MADKTINSAIINGNLNNRITTSKYDGETTDTASVTVDNDNRTISVDVIRLPNKITIVDHSTNYPNLEKIIYDGGQEKEIEINHYMIKEVEPTSTDNLKEYALFKNGEELTTESDRIIIPKDYIVKDIVFGICEEAGVPIPELKVGDPYLDITLGYNTFEEHKYVSLVKVVDIYIAGHALTLTRKETEDGRKLMEFAVDPDEIKKDIDLTGIHEKIEAETTRATDRENELESTCNTKLEEEKLAREKAEADINTKIDSNFESLTNSINETNIKLSEETQNRINNDTNLDNKLDKEIQDRKDAIDLITAEYLGFEFEEVED